MNAIKLGAIVLIVAGVLGLAYGGFSYTRNTEQAKIGPFAITVQDRERINVPIWAGVAAVLVGVGLMAVGRRHPSRERRRARQGQGPQGQARGSPLRFTVTVRPGSYVVWILCSVPRYT